MQWNLFLHSRPVNVFWMVKITQTLLVGQNEAIIQALQHWNTIIILSQRTMQIQVFSQLQSIQNGQIMSNMLCQTCIMFTNKVLYVSLFGDEHTILTNFQCLWSYAHYCECWAGGSALAAIFKLPKFENGNLSSSQDIGVSTNSNKTWFKPISSL